MGPQTLCLWKSACACAFWALEGYTGACRGGTDPWFIAGSVSLGPGLPPAEPRKMPQPLPYMGSEQNSESPVEAQGRVVPIR